MIYNNKRGISPVVATALLIVVAVVSVISFQTWFGGFSSGVFTKTENSGSTEIMNTKIENVIGSSLYFNNADSENISINQVKFDGVDCNISGNFTEGINEMDLSVCASNVTTQTPEIVIYSNKGIFSKKVFVKTPIVYVNTTPGNGSSLSAFAVEVWNASFDNRIWGNSNSEAFSTAIDSTGNVYVAGYYNDDLSDNYYTIKYNSSGTEIWNASYDGGFDDVIYSIAVDSNDNLYVTGVSDDGLSDNYYTIKYNGTNGVEIWNKTYDSSLWEEAHGIAVDSSDNVYVTGYTYDGSTTNFYTIKYNGTNGIEIWNASYDSTNYDNGYGVAVDSFDNVYVTGRNGDGLTDNYYTIKYNGTNGVEIWNKTFDSTAYEVARAIAIDNNNNLYVTGESNYDGFTNNYLTIKYNSTTGDEIWNASYDGSSDDTPYGIDFDSSNNIYVTGKTYDGFTNNFLTIKYNSSGAEVWNASYDAIVGDDISRAVAVDSINNVLYVTGASRDPSFVNTIYTLKYDVSDGSEIWNRNFTYGSLISQSDTARAIAVDSVGNVFITGNTGDGVSNLYHTIKYDGSDGSQIWNVSFDTANEDYAFGVAVDSSDNVYVTGYTHDGSTYNIYTIKYDGSDGSEIWNTTLDTGFQETASAIAVDGSNNIYITGLTDMNGLNNDYLTIKYNGVTGNQIWNSTFDGGGSEEGTGITVDSSENVYVTGIFNSNIYTIKYDGGDGSEIWNKTIDRGGSESSAKITSDANYIYVTGKSGNIITFYSEYLTIKYDLNGNYIWNATQYGGDGNIAGIAVDVNSSVYVSGRLDDALGGSTFGDFYTIKYNSSGSEIWNISYASVAWDTVYGIAVDTSGNVYVTGDTEIAGSANYYTIKYEQQYS